MDAHRGARVRKARVSGTVPWCSGLAYVPVKDEIAGSNPVGTAASRFAGARLVRSGDPWSLQAVTIGQPAVLANGRLPRTPSTRGWSEALRPRRWALMELRTPDATPWRPLGA